MARPGLTPTRDLGAARWLTEALPCFGGRVDQLVPPGYPAYLRLLHRPDQGRPDEGEPTSWAEVAARHGTVLHPAAQWGPLARDEQEEPMQGTLDRLTLALLVGHLARHTDTPGTCHLALWEGTGKSPRSWDAYPTFLLPGRTHFLLPPVAVADVPACALELEVAGMEEQSRRPEGLPELLVLGRPTRPEDGVRRVRAHRASGHVQSPTLWWPEDRAWVVHSEIDYDSTVIAGSRGLADALLAEPGIECLTVDPDTSLLANADRVNGA